MSLTGGYKKKTIKKIDNKSHISGDNDIDKDIDIDYDIDIDGYLYKYKWEEVRHMVANTTKIGVHGVYGVNSTLYNSYCVKNTNDIHFNFIDI